MGAVVHRLERDVGLEAERVAEVVLVVPWDEQRLLCLGARNVRIALSVEEDIFFQRGGQITKVYVEDGELA